MMMIMVMGISHVRSIYIYSLYNEIGSGERVALSKLAMEKLDRTGRPFRLAIDASIWQFQAQSGKGMLCIAPRGNLLVVLDIYMDRSQAERIRRCERSTTVCYACSRSPSDLSSSSMAPLARPLNVAVIGSGIGLALRTR